ncbi:MAG: hypothetical protein ACI8PZ_005143 [Myxococcota bacterium]|jgi:hypothetical protein
MRWFWILAVLAGGCESSGGGGDDKPPAEICDNLEDDDLDELADCADPDCAALCGEVCTNGTDDDLDGLTDCLDDDCDGLCPENCGDGRDNDGDGAIDCDDRDCFGSCPEVCDDGFDNDGDGKVDCLDEECVDPACAEVCSDGRDNDADGLVDCAADDCNDPVCDEACADGRDNDADGRVDCDDSDCDGDCPEVCDDGRDNDADGRIDCDDDECESECDADGDGFFKVAYGGDDCDDSRADVNPSRPEICNGEEALDDDCDGLVDEDDPDIDVFTLIAFGPDADGDGYGTDRDVQFACQQPDGWGFANQDCDDARADINPAMPEICNPDGPVDDDCDGLVDDADPDVTEDSYLEWYADRDADGFGADDDFVYACSRPDGTAARNDDCDDADPSVGPPSLWYPDADRDGFGAGEPVDPTPTCDPPGPDLRPDWVGLDCDDGAPLTFPGAEEVCEDGIDQDCDGADESCGCYDVRVAIVGTSFWVPTLETFLDSVPSWTSERVDDCRRAVLDGYDVLIVNGNPTCAYGDVDAWVDAGGALIGTPWVVNNGYADDFDSLPVAPGNRGADHATPISVTVTDPSDPILDGVVFVDGDSVGVEFAQNPRVGSYASVKHDAIAEVAAVVSWEYGSGRAVYLDFQYNTNDADVAGDFEWGRRLLANAIAWGVCETGPPPF